MICVSESLGLYQDQDISPLDDSRLFLRNSGILGSQIWRDSIPHLPINLHPSHEVIVSACSWCTTKPEANAKAGALKMRSLCVGFCWGSQFTAIKWYSHPGGTNQRRMSKIVHHQMAKCTQLKHYLILGCHWKNDVTNDYAAQIQRSGNAANEKETKIEWMDCHSVWYSALTNVSSGHDPTPTDLKELLDDVSCQDSPLSSSGQMMVL